ncbi:hypothetical protein AGR9A_Lc20078 [Agrobacterium salinitolerans str. Hayward 0363]|nr:hypothetical protein AGR9A_Lc20078 [Agrobacterium salinitolerans str. Hayward 0363]
MKRMRNTAWWWMRAARRRRVISSANRMSLPRRSSDPTRGRNILFDRNGDGEDVVTPPSHILWNESEGRSLGLRMARPCCGCLSGIREQPDRSCLTPVMNASLINFYRWERSR